MIAALAIAALCLAVVFLAGAVGLALLGACMLASQWLATRAVIEQAEAEFSDYADEAIAVAGAGLWSDEENEILLGRRPFR